MGKVYCIGFLLATKSEYIVIIQNEKNWRVSSIINEYRPQSHFLKLMLCLLKPNESTRVGCRTSKGGYINVDSELLRSADDTYLLILRMQIPSYMNEILKKVHGIKKGCRFLNTHQTLPVMCMSYTKIHHRSCAAHIPP